MGFGGGGSGSFVLPNHTHTNVLADGGALDEAVSLINDGINDITLLAWIQAILTARAPTQQNVSLSSNFTTASTTMVDVTGMTFTMPNVTGGKANVTASLVTSNGNLGEVNSFRFMDDSTGRLIHTQGTMVANFKTCIGLTCSPSPSTSGQVVKLQCHASTPSTCTVWGTTTLYISEMESFEVYP